MSLNVYASDLRRITEDLNLFIEDLILLKEGKKLVYAPDFSEIYALANPALTNSEFRTFRDDNWMERGIAQSAALNHLFFSSNIKTLLLPPYKHELHRWLLRSLEQINEEVAELAHRASVEIKLLTAEPQFIRVTTIINATEDLQNDSNAEEVLDYFENKAGNLVRLLDETAETHAGVIKQLMESPGYIPIEDVFDSPLSYNETVYRNWIESLAKARGADGAHQIANDALAVAQVCEQNCRESGPILRIVTRSKTMRDVAVERIEGSEARFWMQSYGNPIRHPRVFGFLRQFTFDDYDHAIVSSERMIRAIHSFIDSVSEMGEKDVAEEKVGDIEKIKELWHAGVQLRATINAAASGDRYTNIRSKNRKRILDVLGRVRDRDMLRSVLVDRVAELVGKIEQDYINLGYSIQTFSRQLGLYPHEVNLESNGEYTIITSSAFRNPYYIYFRSAQIQSIMSRLKEEPRFDISNISQLLTNMGAEGDPLFTYEKLLLMAFIFSISDEWDLADSYVDSALNIVTRRNKIDTSEAEFLKILCCSRVSKSPDYQDALNRIQRIRLMTSEVRLKCELSSLAFRFGENGCLDQYHAVSLANEAVNELEGNHNLPLLIMMHNNLAYFHLSKLRNDKKARVAYSRLEKLLLEKSSLPEGKLWPNVLDTYYWGAWLLKKDSLTKSQCIEISNSLKKLMDGINPRKPWISTIQSHVEQIEATL